MRRRMSIHGAFAAGMAAAVFLVAAQLAGAHPDLPKKEQTGPKSQSVDSVEAPSRAHAGMLAAAAEALKLNRDELRRELRKGRTLAELAEQRGIGKEELIRRLAEDAEKRLDARVAEGRLSASRAAQLKASIKAHIEAAVDSRDLLKPIHRHPGHRFLMHKIAAVLGMPGSELESRLAEGRSIAEIAKSRGLSEDQLIEKLKDSLSEELRHFVRMKHPVRKPQDAKDEAKR